MEKEIQVDMTALLSENIISALGFTSEENYLNVKQGVSGLKRYTEHFEIPEPFMASEIDNGRLEAAFALIAPPTNQKYTKLEKASILSVHDALKNTGINPSDKKVVFIFSSTKGNVFLLDETERNGYEPEQIYLWRSAELIAAFFGNKNNCLTVSNACISGLSALIIAQRALLSGRCDYAIVVGADMLSKFAITGFQSFKALSQEICKPFDVGRTGLNIGEAVATMILSRKNEAPDCNVEFTIAAGRNDANHISGPSRTGEGSYLALKKVLENIDIEDIAFINAHGTATLYNDEMEAISLTRAGLQNVPVNSLKGYFGHTLGAAGVLESIISARALKEGTVLKTYGFETLGVSTPLNIVKQTITTDRKKHFIKLLSGFGGCNIAALYTLY
ncbi:MAG: beta-ketoacyl synthase [Tannerella sp.]|jgi:3-oxoacyl-[acyl-carrier-protein] synthase-1|nr:beta-ketoacyl synthase [Tannerella sp.]